MQYDSIFPKRRKFTALSRVLPPEKRERQGENDKGMKNGRAVCEPCYQERKLNGVYDPYAKRKDCPFSRGQFFLFGKNSIFL